MHPCRLLIRVYPCSSVARILLENQLQGELALPRRVGGAYGPEGGTGGLGVRYPEVRVVQNVEELRPELQPRLFADPEVLVD
jgi:hypothetical protein